MPITNVTNKLTNELISYSSNYANTDIYKLLGKTVPDTTEYFLVENRQSGASAGTWDYSLAQGGILIWHIITYPTATPLNVSMTLEVADGNGDTNGTSMSRDSYRASPDSNFCIDCKTGGNLQQYKYPGSYSSAQVTNIHGSGNSMYLDLAPYRFGRMPTNESWSQEMYIGDDFIVPPDTTLTISAPYVYVADGKKIDVYGKLKVTAGTIFTKTNGGTYWSGIDVKNGGTLEATSDFTIQYANCGIDLYSG